MSFKPVDLSAANSIIQAFQHGYALKQQKAQFEKELAMKAEEAKIRKEENDRQFDLDKQKLEYQHQHEDSQMQMAQEAHNLGKKIQLQNIVEKYQKSGVEPPDAQITRPIVHQPEYNEPQDLMQTMGNPNMPISQTLGLSPGQEKIDTEFGSTTMLNPVEQAKKEAQILDIKQGPLLERESRKIQEQSEAKAKLEMTLKKMELERDAQKQSHEDELKDREFANRLEVENVRGNYRTKAAQISADKVTPGQKDKFNEFSTLENKVKEIQNIFDSTPQGYEKYYKGALSGNIQNLTSQISEPKERFGANGEYSKEDIRQKLADVELSAKNSVAKLGGALTPNEQKLLEQLAPAPGFEVTPGRGKARINGFLFGIQNSKGSMAGSGNSSSTKVGDIKTFSNGKKGKWDGHGWEAIP